MKNEVKNIQSAAYDGAFTVFKYFKLAYFVLDMMSPVSFPIMIMGQLFKYYAFSVYVYVSIFNIVKNLEKLQSYRNYNATSKG